MSNNKLSDIYVLNCQMKSGFFYKAKMWLLANVLSKHKELGHSDIRKAHKTLATSKSRWVQLK